MLKYINMKEEEQKLIEIKNRITDAILKLKLTEKESELDFLESESEKPDFWTNQEKAKEMMQKINSLKSLAQPWREIETEASELLELLATGDKSLAAEIQNQTTALEERLSQKEKELYYSGKYDELPAVLSIYSGAGGADAQDWAEILLSMFIKYGEAQNLAPSIIAETPGSEAGIKNASVEFKGLFAYGKLKSEIGVHRLVRLSPFDADKARHTSFALVEVVPEIEAEDFEIDERDIKIDTFRASGHGGQGVNTTDSAVRLTHLPTKITVTVQNERSQLQNKNTALKILKSRIKAAEEAEREKELKVIKGESMSAEWGSQIRSYVLHPYNMVKDHRTGYETSNTDAVLNGQLEDFVEAYLKKQ